MSQGPNVEESVGIQLSEPEPDSSYERDDAENDEKRGDDE